MMGCARYWVVSKAPSWRGSVRATDGVSRISWETLPPGEPVLAGGFPHVADGHPVEQALSELCGIGQVKLGGSATGPPSVGNEAAGESDSRGQNEVPRPQLQAHGRGGELLPTEV